MEREKKNLTSDQIHVVCRCSRCGQKILECDYFAGDFTLEMKCTRCTRAIIVKGYAFDRLKAYAKRGQALLNI